MTVFPPRLSTEETPYSHGHKMKVTHTYTLWSNVPQRYAQWTDRVECMSYYNTTLR